jgi:DNA-binding PadR family transcriptional regulator
MRHKEMLAMQQDDEITASNWLKETQKGYIRIATLILLSKKPHHGYEIMKEIKERTGGFWKPTAGGIYPILKSLKESGYIKGEWDAETRRRKRIYIITEAGKNVLKRAIAKENQLAATMRSLFEEYMKSVLDVDMQFNQALKIPLPLSELLRETDETGEDSIKRLEERSSQMQDMIRQMKKQVRIIKKRISKLKDSTSEVKSGEDHLP